MVEGQQANMLLGKCRETAPEGMKRLSRSRNNARLWMCDGESQVRCSKEQYCIGTWNLSSMNQGKLEVVKLKMPRLNIDILGISELKWTGMVNLTQMTIISTTVGRNPLEEME